MMVITPWPSSWPPALASKRETTPVGIRRHSGRCRHPVRPGSGRPSERRGTRSRRRRRAAPGLRHRPRRTRRGSLRRRSAAVPEGPGRHPRHVLPGVPLHHGRRDQPESHGDDQRRLRRHVGHPRQRLRAVRQGGHFGRRLPGREERQSPVQGRTGRGVRQGTDLLPEHRRQSAHHHGRGVRQAKTRHAVLGQALGQEVRGRLPLDALHRRASQLLPQGSAEPVRIRQRRRHHVCADGHRAQGRQDRERQAAHAEPHVREHADH